MIFCILFITNNCLSQARKSTVQKIKIDTSKIAVLKTEKYRGFQKFKSADLDNSEILLAEKLLAKSVHKYNKGNNWSTINLKKYNRQYVAAINQKGEKIIYINCYCEPNAINWKEELSEVDDGGNCFFSLMINLSLQLTEELDVNGP